MKGTLLLRPLACLLALSICLTLSGQGGNTGIGDAYDPHESLIQRLAKLEKKNHAFNLYINVAGSLQGSNDEGDWNVAFRARHLRLEMTGVIQDRLYYRLRHRLERSNAPLSLDRLAAATDMMMIGWKFNEHWRIYGGKMCQFWGGFEYDENPLYIYQYSDLLNHMDVFFVGGAVAWTPLPTQEFVLNVTNSYNNTYADTYAGETGIPEAARVPVTGIFNWNGSFLDGQLQTRWGGGTIVQAKGCFSKMLFLGQKLHLPTLQWYLDYMGAWEDIDHFRIATADFGTLQRKVSYHSIVTKAQWQFVRGWNLMGKFMYEMAVTPDMGNYRTALGYIASVEFFPLQDEDFRVFLSYTGQSLRFAEATGLPGRLTHRAEIGFIYRLKAY